jgi:hypothetical protein
VPGGERGADHDNLMIFSPRSEAARALDRVADTLWAHLSLSTPRPLEPRRSA